MHLWSRKLLFFFSVQPCFFLPQWKTKNACCSKFRSSLNHLFNLTPPKVPAKFCIYADLHLQILSNFKLIHFSQRLDFLRYICSKLTTISLKTFCFQLTPEMTMRKWVLNVYLVATYMVSCTLRTVD